MRTDRYSRRGLALAAAALLTTVACTAATANPGAAATLTAATSPAARTAAPVSGWRVVKTIGPDRVNVSGLLDRGWG